MKKITKNDLIKFENEIIKLFNNSKIRAPVHLHYGNEENLIKIFKKIKKNDWVLCSWRNHYHALLKGINPNELKNDIIEGRSMSINSNKHKFYSSSIVGGIIPIALGLAQSFKLKKKSSKVWVFIGDMTFETGIFHECYKYSKNFSLPIKFVVEDNNLSTNSPTNKVWGKKSEIPKNVKYYNYKRLYPHHGTGSWVLF